MFRCFPLRLIIGPGPQGNNVPNYQPQAYPGYPQGAHPFRPPPGLYNPNSSAYYGAPPSVMVSPGGGYVRPHGSYYPRGGEYMDPSYGPYQGQGYQQHPMYAAEMQNRNNYDPRSQMGYPSQPTGMDFSRAVSSSFGDNNSKSSTDKGRNNEKGSTDTLPNLNNYYKSSDDRSISSGKSDTSWKLLNQVASIEEEKFRSAEDSRLDTTSPIGDHAKNSHLLMKDGLDSTNQALTSLSSVASMQEPLDTSNSKDELDLIQCASSGSLLFNAHGDSFVKRGREEREDAEDDARGRDDDEIRRGPSSSPPNVANLSMQDKSDNATRPLKKRREDINDYYDQPPSYTFSLESAPSFSKDQQYQSLPNLAEKPRPPSMLEPFDNQRDKNDAGRDEMLMAWEIKGQDSFGANFSMGSNMSVHENVDDGPLLTSSFSFDKEANNENDEFNGKLNDFERSQHNSKKTGHGNYPPPSATWVTNTSSLNGNKPEAHHRQSNLYHPVPTNPAQSFSSNSSMQSTNRMMPKHHHDMIRAFSHDSSSSATSGMHPTHMHPHFGPRHGPYGAPLPPHIPQSDAHLPPSFRPPPSNMHPHMARRPPPGAVYMMSNPTGGRQSVVRNTSMDSSVNKVNAGGVYSWTKSDDARLTEIMKKFKNPKDWEPVAEEFGGGKS